MFPWQSNQDTSWISPSRKVSKKNQVALKTLETLRSTGISEELHSYHNLYRACKMTATCRMKGERIKGKINSKNIIRWHSRFLGFTSFIAIINYQKNRRKYPNIVSISLLEIEAWHLYLLANCRYIIIIVKL